MPVILKKYNIAYFPVPKVACSSIKHLFYLLQHDKDFVDFKDNTGKYRDIHNAAYPTLNTSQDDWSRAANMHRIAVVRDPVDRLVSAYYNRVLHHKELAENVIDLKKAAVLGLRPDPDLDEFIDNLEPYRVLSRPMKHHTDPQTSFLGYTLEYFDKVYKFEDLRTLESDLRERTGLPIALPHMQKGKGKGKAAENRPISAARVRKIIELYAGDYALLKGLYSPESATNKYVSEIRELLRETVDSAVKKARSILQ